jgi:hypothetical protein
MACKASHRDLHGHTQTWEEENQNKTGIGIGTEQTEAKIQEYEKISWQQPYSNMEIE